MDDDDDLILGFCCGGAGGSVFSAVGYFRYPLVPYPHTYIALYFSYAKVTCNTQKQEIVVHPS